MLKRDIYVIIYKRKVYWLSFIRNLQKNYTNDNSGYKTLKKLLKVKKYEGFSEEMGKVCF